jgi:hypothetical protein
METPVVIMDWTFFWSFYNNKWSEFFPEEIYGKVIFDTHIYDFKDTVKRAETSWDILIWPLVELCAF